MRKKYLVELTDPERDELLCLIKTGTASARKISRARALLLAAENKSDRQIAEHLHIGRSTVERVRKRFVEGNLDWALNERSRPGKTPKLNGQQEALLTALACSDPPEGRQRWTMQLLADRLVEMGETDTISDETVRRLLKKTT